jgi:biotin carboxyl carrier protein
MKYRITIDGQAYEVEIADLHARPLLVTVDGEPIQVDVERLLNHVAPSAQPAAPPRIAAPATPPPMSSVPTGVAPRAGLTVRAPIPGVIVALLVHPGDQVAYGQELCTIEAMKMRNNIRAARAGRIAEILVSPGQTVNHNDPLMRFEEVA